MVNVLPSRAEMLEAMRTRDKAYEGVFFTAVKTTGIFCRPGCPARSPKPENVEFYPSVRDALFAGFRACRRCRPLEPEGAPPDWLRPLLAEIDEEPERRWRDRDLVERGIEPARARRWFQAQHGMTFHAYHRSRRLGAALGTLRKGRRVLDVALAHGYDSASGFQDAFQRVLGTTPRSGRHLVAARASRILTPLGPMVVVATDVGIALLEFADRRMLETQLTRLSRRIGCRYVAGSSRHVDHLEREFAEYFAGDRAEFTVPMVTDGTDFQQAVWDRLVRIPAGETISYQTMARDIGRPTAVRAVGRANGDNRLTILVPCHRVVGSDGKLTGYGGGLWRKQWLLDHEDAMVTKRNAASRGRGSPARSRARA